MSWRYPKRNHRLLQSALSDMQRAQRRAGWDRPVKFRGPFHQPTIYWRPLFLTRDSQRHVALFEVYDKNWKCVEVTHQDLDFLRRIRHMHELSEHLLKHLAKLNFSHCWGGKLTDRPRATLLLSVADNHPAEATAEKASLSQENNTMIALNNPKTGPATALRSSIRRSILAQSGAEGIRDLAA